MTTTRNADPTERFREWIPARTGLLLLVALHLVLSLYRLESYPAPWVDEGWIGEVSATIAAGHPPGSPSHGTLYRYSDRLYWMPPLYFYGLGGWFALFSVDLTAGRVFNGLIGLVTLIAVFAWGRRRIGSTAAFLAGLVLLFEPFWWKTVRTIRFESLSTLLGFLLIAAIDRALSAEESGGRARGAWIVAGVVAGLALNVHPNALLFAAGGLAVILARAGARALGRPGPWLALGAAALLALPYTLYCLADRANGFANLIGQNSFHLDAGASEGPALLREWKRYAAFYPWPWRVPAALATVAVLVAAARRAGSAFVKTMLLPVAVMLTGLFLLPNKSLLYLVPTVPFTALLAAEWWRSRRSRAALAAIAVLVISGAAVEGGLLARNHGCNYRTAFAAIRAELEPGDRVAGTFVTWWAAWPRPFHEFSRGATIESVRAFDPSVILLGDRQWTQEVRGRFAPLARDLEAEFARNGRKTGEAGDDCIGRISIWRLTR